MTTELMTDPTRSNTLTIVRPLATAKELIALHKQITDLIRDALEENRDYGTMPGTKEKVLFKPGAERISIAFGCSPKYDVAEREADHDRSVVWRKRKKIWANKFHGDKTFTWQDEEGESIGLYRYVIRCRLEQAGGRIVAEGLASCSTMESKYIDRPRECENTVLKMAEKRAFVAAVLNAFGLSDRFTQDLEEEDTRREREAAAQDGPPPEPTLQDKMKFIHAALADIGVKDDTRHAWFGWLLGREIKSAKDMTDVELDRVTKHLRAVGDLAQQLDKIGVKEPKAKRVWLEERLGRAAKPSEITEDEAQKLAVAAAEKTA